MITNAVESVFSQKKSGPGTKPDNSPTAGAQAETTPQRFPVPLAVLHHYLRRYSNRHSTSSSSSIGSATDSHGPSASPAILVEVETTQGYVYAGRLIDVDPFYNMTLADAFVRRRRACDIERECIRQKFESLLDIRADDPHSSRMAHLIPDELIERHDSAARPTLVGHITIRSSHVLMVVFLEEPQAEAQAHVPVPNDTRKEGRKTANTEGTHHSHHHSVARLAGVFKSTAVAVKKAMDRQRQADRQERRQRIAAAAKRGKTTAEERGDNSTSTTTNNNPVVSGVKRSRQ